MSGEWEEPHEWSPGDVISSARLNRVNACLRWLKGLLLGHKARHEAGGADPVENLNRLAVQGVEVVTPGRVLQNVTAAPDVLRYGLQRVADVKTTVPASEVVVNFPPLTPENFLVIYFKIANASASHESILCFVQDDTTPSNYYSQFLKAEDIWVSAGRHNSPIFAYILANTTAAGLAAVSMHDWGNFRGVYVNVPTFNFNTYSIISLQTRTIEWRGGLTQVTRLRFRTGSGASSIGAGSRITAYMPIT